MPKISQNNLDSFIEALEEMIDARDDMWEEEKYSNVNRMMKIKSERYIPAKEKLKDFLEKIIEQTSLKN
jgi:hypothetical protein